MVTTTVNKKVYEFFNKIFEFREQLANIHFEQQKKTKLYKISRYLILCKELTTKELAFFCFLPS